MFFPRLKYLKNHIQQSKKQSKDSEYLHGWMMHFFCFLFCLREALKRVRKAFRTNLRQPNIYLTRFGAPHRTTPLKPAKHRQHKPIDPVPSSCVCRASRQKLPHTFHTEPQRHIGGIYVAEKRTVGASAGVEKTEGKCSCLKIQSA